MKNTVSIDSYPADWLESTLPHIAVKVRYRKNSGTDYGDNRQEALEIADKIEKFLDGLER